MKNYEPYVIRQVSIFCAIFVLAINTLLYTNE
jgi:hypothetical protein